MDCDVIDASQEFFHVAERNWFIDNCLIGPAVWIAYGEVPGIGERVMEIFTVDTAICQTGLVSHTVYHRSNLEAFSYEFRDFCAFSGVSTLRFPPPPFACPDDKVIEVQEVRLDYLNGLFRHEIEIFCVLPQDPEANDAESSAGPGT